MHVPASIRFGIAWSVFTFCEVFLRPANFFQFLQNLCLVYCKELEDCFTASSIKLLKDTMLSIEEDLIAEFENDQHHGLLKTL
jgi:hypothetical protein